MPCFIATAEGDGRLLLVAHHLVIDGVSWRILLEDLQAAYRALRDGTRIELPEKSSSFQLWSKRIQRYIDTHAAEQRYWHCLSDIPVDLPCDQPDGANTVAEQSSIAIRLSRLQTEALLKEVPAAYRTRIDDVLLTALGRALCSWSGHERILIDVEGHGREALFDDVDLSRTVGWFTSLYPVVVDARGTPKRRSSVSRNTCGTCQTKVSDMGR